MEEQEIWKDVPNYEGLYMVSDKGRIKSIDRIIVRSNGRPYIYKGKILPGRIMFGYQIVQLCNLGNEKQFRVHRLVGIAFIPNPENKPEINHKDGIKSNNWTDNLEWNTPSENIIHSFKYLNRKRSRAWLGKTGAEHPISKKVIDISNGKIYDSLRQCATRNNMKSVTLGNMLRGHRRNKTNFRYATNCIG